MPTKRASTARETLQARIARYREADPADVSWPATARLGRRLLDGGEVTAADAVALGRDSALMTVIVRDFERAGYWVRTRRDPPTSGKGRGRLVYYLDGGADAVPRDEPPPPGVGWRQTQPRARRAKRPAMGDRLPDAPPEANGKRPARRTPHLDEAPPDTMAHPRLGALMSVRALALDGDGGLLVHLTDAEGAVWQVHVVGRVPPPRASP